MEDIDASLETLTEAIQDALRVAAHKCRPDEDRSRPIPLFILAHIREKNWLGECDWSRGDYYQAQDVSFAEVAE